MSRGVAQSGSAHVWGACGRWFESSRPDHLGKSRNLWNHRGFGFLFLAATAANWQEPQLQL